MTILGPSQKGPKGVSQPTNGQGQAASTSNNGANAPANEAVSESIPEVVASRASPRPLGDNNPGGLNEDVGAGAAVGVAGASEDRDVILGAEEDEQVAEAVVVPTLRPSQVPSSTPWANSGAKGVGSAATNSPRALAAGGPVNVATGEKRPSAAYDVDAPPAKKRHNGGHSGRGKRHKVATSNAPLTKSNKALHQQQQQQQQQQSAPEEMAASPVVERPPPAVSPAGEGGYNSEDEYSHLGVNLTQEQWEEKDRRFERFVKKKGFVIKHMGDDGSCLFRAVADQVFGDQEMHIQVRGHCMDYIEQNADYFGEYMTEDLESYVERKRYVGVHGNHLEIQAMSEMYNRPIYIYCYSLEPINIFQTLQHNNSAPNAPIRLTYHRDCHYNSLVDPYKATIGVGLGLPGFSPGAADRNLMKDAVKASESDLVEKAMLEDKLKATDWEATNEAIEEQVARESYLQWLRDNERRNSQPPAHYPPFPQQQQQQQHLLTSSTVTSGDLRGLGSPKASCSNSGSGGNSPKPVGGTRKKESLLHAAVTKSASSPSSPSAARNTASPKAGCSTARDSPQPSCSGNHDQKQQQQHSSESNQNSNFGNYGLGDNFQLYETGSYLDSNMYGFEDDWGDNDVINQVLARSQQEYYDSLRRAASDGGKE